MEAWTEQRRLQVGTVLAPHWATADLVWVRMPLLGVSVLHSIKIEAKNK